MATYLSHPPEESHAATEGLKCRTGDRRGAAGALGSASRARYAGHARRVPDARALGVRLARARGFIAPDLALPPLGGEHGDASSRAGVGGPDSAPCGVARNQSGRLVPALIPV